MLPQLYDFCSWLLNKGGIVPLQWSSGVYFDFNLEVKSKHRFLLRVMMRDKSRYSKIILHQKEDARRKLRDCFSLKIIASLPEYIKAHKLIIIHRYLRITSRLVC